MHNVTDALSWKLPGPGEQSLSGPDSEGLNIDPIEVLAHQSQIKEYVESHKVKKVKHKRQKICQIAVNVILVCIT